jgi:hypothetical protein
MHNSNIALHAIFLWRIAVLTFAAAVSTPAALAQSRDIKLQENAPDRYVVEKGDTLWGIAGKFLKEPYRWPEIWRMNQEQIKNPHRISPGDVIVLDRRQTPPALALLDTVKLSPRVRTEVLASEAIPSIPPRVIEPFLTQPLVIDISGLDKAPRIVGTEENRVHLGSGGIAYVTGISAGEGTVWQIYRQGKPLIDPDTKNTLGYEAVFLGTGRVSRAGNPATMEIVSAVREISSGDRLVAVQGLAPRQYVPRAPSSLIRGRVIGTYDGISTSEAGRNSIVAINKGKRDGIEDGHVLAIVRAGSEVADPLSVKSRDAAPSFRLPDERYGLLFIFRVFDAVSYAMVMESSRPVTPADIVQTP